MDLAVLFKENRERAKNYWFYLRGVVVIKDTDSVATLIAGLSRTTADSLIALNINVYGYALFCEKLLSPPPRYLSNKPIVFLLIHYASSLILLVDECSRIKPFGLLNVQYCFNESS